MQAALLAAACQAASCVAGTQAPELDSCHTLAQPQLAPAYSASCLSNKSPPDLCHQLLHSQDSWKKLMATCHNPCYSLGHKPCHNPCHNLSHRLVVSLHVAGHLCPTQHKPWQRQGGCLPISHGLDPLQKQTAALTGAAT